MAKKYGSITVVAYAQTRDGGLVDVDTLNEEQKRKLATELSIRLLNTAYAGQGITFFPASCPPDDNSDNAETRKERQVCVTGNG